MNEVRAFVGHSFTDDDADVVSVFLTYFDQVSDLHPSFKWTNATQSEPVDLRDKVLALMEGKNVFIGICTRKERVASDSDFQPVLFANSKVAIARDALQWKTSDWVIQEIGLAIGRGMDLILLVEEGVRSPGGLQGNIEYLPFRRATPQASFGKLLEMIRALSPPASSRSGPIPDPTASDAAISAPIVDAATDGTAIEQPTPEWDRDDYHRAYVIRLITNDDAGAEEIASAYLRSAQASEAEMRGVWEAQSEWTKGLFDKGGSLSRVRQLVAEFPGNHEIRGYLGKILAKYGEPLEAADCEEAAAELAPTAQQAVPYLCSAAIERSRGSQRELAMATLEKAKERGFGFPESQKQILRAIEEIAEIQKDSELKLEALEGYLEIYPDDTGVRFSAGYEHSQIGNDDLALRHYLKIPYSERTSMTWNNLGVTYQEFGMPGKSVACYRHAATAGESLAMSNLGYKFLEAGFFEESQREFDRALTVESFHKNVGQGISALKSAPDREDEKEADLIASSAEKAAFYRALGRAVSLQEISLTGTWKGPHGDLSLNLSSGNFAARGEYAVTNALAQLRPNPPADVRYTIVYTGKVVGKRIQGNVTRTPDGQTKVFGLMSSNENSNDFLMYISDDGRIINVAESARSRKPSFYTITSL